jgi:GTPase SAR1 family protein
LGDNGVGKTTLLECLAHLEPVFNSIDQEGSKDPPVFVEPKVAAADNSVIDNLGRNGDIEFMMTATFAVDSCLDVGEPPSRTVETWTTFTRTNGKTDNIETSTWGKENNIAESKWKEFSKFQPPLILGYGAGRHMGLGNLENLAGT